MKTKRMYVMASCAAGWGRGVSLASAIREMVRYSRGYVNPKRMTLSRFLEAVDNQQITLHLYEEMPDGKFRDAGCLGDNYNTTKLFEEEA